MRYIRFITLRRVVVATAVSGLCAFGAAAPALAGSAPGVPATVTVGSQITETLSVTSLSYGSATYAVNQVPQPGAGVNGDGSVTLTLSTNDPSGLDVTASAPDWTSGSMSFPASSLASNAASCPNGTTGVVFPGGCGSLGGGPYQTWAQFVEGTKAASVPALGGSMGGGQNLSQAGSWTFAQLFALTVPNTAPSSPTAYSTTITDTATGL